MNMETGDLSVSTNSISKGNVKKPYHSQQKFHWYNMYEENLSADLLGTCSIKQPPTPSPVHSPCPALSAPLAPE